MKTFYLATIVSLLFACCSTTRNSSADLQKISIAGDWKLISIENEAASSAFPKKNPIIHFDTEMNKVSGNAGCNSFSGPLKIEGETIDLKQPFMMTKMYCEGVDESRFMNTLSSATGIHFENANTLHLLSNGKMVMVYDRVQ